MNIIIDSSIICADFQLKGSYFRVLFDSLDRIGARLSIPQLVVDEVKNKYAECLWDNKSKTDRIMLDFKRLTGEVIANSVSEDFVKEKLKDYNQMLTNKLSELEAIILKYPAIPHEHLVQRALSRKKPFSESGKGYRDSLIWESVVELMSENKNETVYFINANSHDFCDKELALHPDLIVDLEKKGLNPKNIVIFNSLEGFIDKHIKPTLEALESIKSQLLSRKPPHVTLHDIILAKVDESLPGKDVDLLELDFPQEYENPTISSIQDIYNIEVLDVRKLHSGEIYVIAEIDAECEFDFFIFKSDFYAMSEEKIPFIWDYDWNEHYVAASGSNQIHVMLYLTFDSKLEEITSFEVGAITGLSRTE